MMQGLLIAIMAALTGILSGMGAGGGTVLVPGLVYLFGVPQHVAQGAVALSFVPAAAVAAWTHWRNGFARLDCVWRLAMGSVAGALIGATLAADAPAATLRRGFGLYLAVMAVYCLLGPQDRG
jgi:uncharacterized membrane protein YfcA